MMGGKEKAKGPTIGDILAAHPSARMTLMAQEDEWAAQVAAQLKDEINELGQRLGLTILHFGIKKPSRAGMIKVTIRSGQGVNLHPRSPVFRKFARIVQPHGLWLAWVSVKPKEKEGRDG